MTDKEKLDAILQELYAVFPMFCSRLSKYQQTKANQVALLKQERLQYRSRCG